MAQLRSLFLLLALWPALLAGSAGMELGIPRIRNFRPRDYGADPQNWAVAQDARGLAYVGNNLGVLEYDGVRWRLIPTPKGGTVRSLGLGPDGRVYVGAMGEFGVLAPDASGRLAFQSLSGGLQACPRFTDVWVTAATPRGMLFQSREALFLYEGGRIREWKAETSFHTSFVVDGRVFVREREIGLLELKGDQLDLVEGGTRFKAESVFAMASLAGPGGPGGILVGSRNQGLFRLKGNRLTPFPTEADAYLKANALYHGTRLADGSLALATLRGGVLVLSPGGRTLGLLNRGAGLLGDNVKQVFQGRGSVLWLALDTGLAQVEWPTAFTSFDDRLGMPGQVWDITRHQGRLYVATGQGLSVLEDATSPLPHAAFRPVPGLASQCPALLPMGDDLLVASSQGVFAVRGDRSRPVRPSSQAAISMLASRRQPGRVFVGMQGQLVSLRKDPRAPSGWIDEGPVPGLEDDYYYLAEDDAGALWLGTGSGQVVRLTLPEGWHGGAAPGLRSDVFGPAQGLESSSIPWVAWVRGGLAAGTHRGVFRFDPGSGRFQPHPLFAGLFPDGSRWVRSLREDGRGRLWMAVADEARHQDSHGCATDGPAGLVWEDRPFQSLGDMVTQAIYPEADGIVWFGGSEGVRRFDPAVAGRGGPAFAALVRKVAQGDRVVHTGDGETGAPPHLAFRNGALRFEFAAPGGTGGTFYQVHLDGYDRGWSPWSSEAQKEYTSLPAGRYAFRLRAMDAGGQVSQEAVFPFQVEPPRYLAWWAWPLYAAALAGLVWLWLRWRTRRLLQRNVFLHARITEAVWKLKDREHLLEAQAADLERMNAELRTLNHHKDQLMGIVVHDLRNPLSGILLALELMAEEEDLQVIRLKVQQALRTGADMRNLIAHFLDIAAIDAGRIHADLESLDGAQALAEAEQHFALAAKAKRIVMERHLPAAPGPVLADRRFLQETLDNLVSNALKFSPEGSRVSLRYEQGQDWARFSVEDQGPGLGPDDYDRLFKRFARLSARPTAGEPSVGLGLSIVKHLVEAMGGRIWVDSEPGRGAAFRVELRRPALRGEAPPEPVQTASPSLPGVPGQ